MKHKLQFALERSLDAAKELIVNQMDHVFAAFLQGDQKVVVPVNLEVNFDGEGMVKFKSRITYKGIAETEFSYDPDQMEFNFEFPGSKFGSLDLRSEETESPADESGPAETSKHPPKNTESKDAGAESKPELFS